MAFHCKNGHSGEVVVYPAVPNEDDPSEARVIGKLGIGIVVDRNGSNTNAWEDGTIGVPKEIYELTQDETEGICVECGADAIWRHE